MSAAKEEKLSTWIGKRVKVKDRGAGVLAYWGPVAFAKYVAQKNGGTDAEGLCERGGSGAHGGEGERGEERERERRERNEFFFLASLSLSLSP